MRKGPTMFRRDATDVPFTGSSPPPPLITGDPGAGRRDPVEINKRQIKRTHRDKWRHIVHGAGAHSRPAYLFRRAEEREKGIVRGKGEVEGLLEAEHDPAVIKEMNGYAAAKIFSTPLFFGGGGEGRGG